MQNSERSERLAASLARSATRRGMLGYIGGVGAGILAVAGRPGGANAQTAPRTDALISAIWSSAEYQSLRSRIAGGSGCQSYDPKTGRGRASAATQPVPTVDGILTTPDQKHSYSVLSFDLLPSQRQRTSYITVLPKLTFTFVDDRLVSVLEHTPDVAQLATDVRGVGRSSAFSKSQVPFPATLRQSAQSARALHDQQPGRTRPGAAPTPAPRGEATTQSVCYCCWETRCISQGLDQSCYWTVAAGCAACCSDTSPWSCCGPCIDNAIAYCTVCTAYECISYYECPCNA